MHHLQIAQNIQIIEVPYLVFYCILLIISCLGIYQEILGYPEEITYEMKKYLVFISVFY